MWQFTDKAVTKVAEVCVGLHEATPASAYMAILNQLKHSASMAFESADRTREASNSLQQEQAVPSDTVGDANEAAWQAEQEAALEQDEEETVGRLAADVMSAQEHAASFAVRPEAEPMEYSQEGYRIDGDWSYTDPNTNEVYISECELCGKQTRNQKKYCAGCYAKVITFAKPKEQPAAKDKKPQKKWVPKVEEGSDVSSTTKMRSKSRPVGSAPSAAAASSGTDFTDL